uniref:Nucleoporin Nup159/Nup146 N-terminal domain-containing protein n=1 Tax=Gadus morhua TaxID=8049 RepID=A0A8C4YZX2_GADMO
MSDDTDSPPEREIKDFQFRQLKKIRVFDSPPDLPKDRSNLLAVSNKFGLIFVGLGRTVKVYVTQEILSVDKVVGNANDKIWVSFDVTPALVEVCLEHPLHNVALSSDELTLSVCGLSAEAALSITFYDVRTLMKQGRQQKLPFASLQPAVTPGTLVQDLKWNPVLGSMVAVCLSDGSMMVLDVTDRVTMQAQLPADNGITCICWSPKGKQVAVGKMNATVSQYTPALLEKKVVPCPNFYSSDNPVKVLDVLWLRTFVFAVVYAAADGSVETPPDLVVITLPKKDEKIETRYLNFNDPVYGTCIDRQHHYFLSQIEDWDVVFATSAASIEVSVIAKDKNQWELWILEDASRAELPVSQHSDDTLPMGLVVDYTSQQEIYITDEKKLPPAPIMLLLSTDGVLCPFSLLNLNPCAKQMVAPPIALPLEGERPPLAGTGFAPAPAVKAPAPFSSAPAGFPPPISSAPGGFPAALRPISSAAPTLPPPASSPAPAPFAVPPAAPAAAAPSGFSFSLPPSMTPTPPAFSLGSSAAFGSAPSASSGPASLAFSFASKPPSSHPAAPSAFAFSTPSAKAGAPPGEASPVGLALSAQRLAAASPLTVFNPPEVATPVASLGVKSLEKQLQQKRGTDPIMTGILDEIAHFQKELDDLKARSMKADFTVGTGAQMKELRKETEDLHVFTLEIKETTESLHGDIGTLKTTLLEGFAGAEDAMAQSELSKDRGYLQLLYKKPLDPRSEERLKEIRRLYQYVMFAVEDVNDVLDMEWEKHLEKKKKQKHMMVPGREALFTTLANNLFIINQQKSRLDQLVKELSSLHLYTKTTAWTAAPPAAGSSSSSQTSTPASLDRELESLRDALLKAKLDTTSPKPSKTQASKLSPVKRSQLRNFLSKGQMPPVRSTAPANLSRSAFLSPKYYEDLDDVSSSSSLSPSLEAGLDPLASYLEPHPAHLELEDELEDQPLPLPVLPMPRHPAVVRTTSIQPGFGGLQSTPASKMAATHSMVPTNKMMLVGADSTALATKTVKHGAPPTEKAIPATLPAHQAAARAAFSRQMANQKPAPNMQTYLHTHIV